MRQVLNYFRNVLQRVGLNNIVGYLVIASLVAIVIYLISMKFNNQVGGASHSPSDTVKGGGASVRKLVLYYAPWCGHCQKLKPTWESLTDQYNGQEVAGELVVLESVNGDENPELIQKYGIDAYPTVIKHNGENVEKYAGKNTLEELSKFIFE